VTASGAQVNWTAPTGWQANATYTATASATGHPTKTCSALASVGACSLSSLDASTAYSVSVQATFDSWAGGSATETVTTSAPAPTDTTAPAPTIATVGKTPGYTNATTPTLTGTAGTQAAASGQTADNGYVTVNVYAGTATSGTAVTTFSQVAVSNGSWTVDWTGKSPLTAARQYTAVVAQSDAANNIGTAKTTFVVDTTAPTVKIASPANNTTVSGVSPTISGSAGFATAGPTTSADATTVSFTLTHGTTTDVGPTSLTVSSADGSWSYKTTALAQSTTFTITVTQTDAAGNSTTVTSKFST
jgi:hypothetical protein